MLTELNLELSLLQNGIARGEQRISQMRKKFHQPLNTGSAEEKARNAQRFGQVAASSGQPRQD
jgi:hypothetical protein